MVNSNIYAFSKFCIVGGAAALTHYLVLMLLIHLTSITLALENLIAFSIAFWVSYFGHRIITFNAQKTRHIHVLPKFLLVACLGFIFNEAFLLTTQHFFHAKNLSTLIILTIVITAIFTFFLSKFFAFKFSG